MEWGEARAVLRGCADGADFSGVAAVWDADGRLEWIAAGYAHRGRRIAPTRATRFATASAAKGLTALTAASLVDDGTLGFDTTLRSVVGDLLPDVDDRVTIEHLLAHTSGVGDYIDEAAGHGVDDHVLTIPAHRLEAPADYAPMIAGHRQVFPPGERFAYNNGAYVMLSIAIEIAAGRTFYDLVDERVCRPAGMSSTAFLRSDQLDGDVALGYLRDGRTNVFHLPVRGAGDGGAYSTVDDVRSLWEALFAGRIVPPDVVVRMVTPGSPSPSGSEGYGLGFWLVDGGAIVALEGMDAGVSFRSGHRPASGDGYVVMSNTSAGAWPAARTLEALVLGQQSTT